MLRLIREYCQEGKVVERRLTDIYHLAGAARITRYELAKLIAETFDLNPKLIRPATMDKLRWIANRPKDSSLDVSRAIRELHNKPLKVKEALERLEEELAFK